MLAVYGCRTTSHRKWAPNAQDSVVCMCGHLVKMSGCGIGAFAAYCVADMGDGGDSTVHSWLSHTGWALSLVESASPNHPATSFFLYVCKQGQGLEWGIFVYAHVLFETMALI